jgi:hypothetical protein
MTSFAKELDRLVRQHTIKARRPEDFIPVVNALYDAANQLASEADRHPWKEGRTNKRPVLTDDTFG